MTTRRELLIAGASAGGAALLSVAAAPADPAAGAAQTRDASRLLRLLEVEQLMLYVYEHVLDGPRITAAQRPAVDALREYEAEHVRVLRRALARDRGAPPAPPSSDAAANRRLARRRIAGRLGQLRSDADALNLLLATERVTVGAYYEALLVLEQPATIGLAVALMASDAQHESILNEAQNPGYLPSAAPYALVSGVH